MTCDLNITDDQRQILDAAASMLGTNYPATRLRDGAIDDIASIAEFGSFMLALPEDFGGTGFTVVEEALLHVLFGRHALSPNALAAAVATRLALSEGDKDMAEGISSGAITVCAAVPDTDGARLLIDAAGATFTLEFGDDFLSLIDLESVEITDVDGLGHGGVRTSRLAANSGDPVHSTEDDTVRQIADLLVSAQLLGVAEATRDLAVEYAKVRTQFGKPIGVFQAVKHHSANMAIQAELLSAQLDMAAVAVRGDMDHAEFQVAALRRLSPRVALFNARAAIQIHGGMGFSAEADVHHYLKLAHVLSRLGTVRSFLDIDAALGPLEPA